MNTLESILDRLPEAARDLKLNLQAVLGDGTLSDAQKFGVAVACAHASHDASLASALAAAARARGVEDAVLEDARAAAALMGMNNVLYRFRHLVKKADYAQKPARLRMNRLVKPLGSKVDFELFCLAVSAVHGCEVCIQSHEKVVVDGGLTTDQVLDAVRIASTVHGTATALTM
jgi:alkyl hydroperoxide reductase subunit D